ncbi:MAG: NAD(P)H-quinone oxidoreductase [Chromatocurvus sp.]
MQNQETPPAERHFVTVDPDDQSLGLAREAMPVPAADQVLIRVDHAGINRADLLQRKGLYPPPEDASPVMGLEVAGTIVARGAQAGDWQIGDRVCALTHGGGYADYTVAPVVQCLPVPRGYSLAQAAALPEALLTIWHNLYQRCRLQSGETVLIHGGASGIGTLGIGMANALGARVLTTAGSTAKCSALLDLGASYAFNYQEQDFAAEIETLGLKDKINVILDMVGGDYIQKNLDVVAAEGRIVSIAFIRGFKAEVNFAPMLLKRVTLTGSTLRAQTFAQKAVMVEEVLEHVYPHLDHGELYPVIDSVFPMAQVADAHARMENSEHMGKILLRMTAD